MTFLEISGIAFWVIIFLIVAVILREWQIRRRICQLRGKGHNIKTIMHETETSPTGDWAEYKLIKENK